MKIFPKSTAAIQSKLTQFGKKFPKTARVFGIVRRRRHPIAGIFFVLLHAVGLVHSVFALFESRTPQGAVAWVISLNTIPVVAVPAYWVFGGNTMEDYLATRSVGVDELRPAARQWLKNISAVEPEELVKDRLLDTLGKISSLPVTENNHAELLADGEETFASIFDAIASAEKYVLVQFYIIRPDGVGNALKDHLVAKAKEGVRVHLVYDDYGSLGLTKEFVGELRDAGAEVTRFMNEEGEPNRYQLNYRNHRKLVVVDGITAFVGGNNVGDEYLGKNPDRVPWRDAHMKLTGPVVTCLQIPFVEDWKWATEKTLEGLSWDLQEAKDEGRGTVQAVCIPSGPSDKVETCSLFFHAAIQAAEERIWISTPYFVPDAGLVTALQLAAKRGVKIKIIIPANNDSFLVERSAYSFLEELNLDNIEIYTFTKGFIHQKVIMIDDEFSAIGSANFDNRSLRLNFEIMVGISDRSFQSGVEAMLTRDLSQCERFTVEDLRAKSGWFKFTVRVCRLLAPIQ